MAPNPGTPGESEAPDDAAGSTTAQSASPSPRAGSYRGGDIDVDTGSIRRGAQQYLEYADRAAALAERLLGLTNRRPLLHGQADDTWNQFYSKWGPAASGLVRHVNQLSRAVGSTAEGADDMAKKFAATEEAATAAAKSVGRQMTPLTSGSSSSTDSSSTHSSSTGNGDFTTTTAGPQVVRRTATREEALQDLPSPKAVVGTPAVRDDAESSRFVESTEFRAVAPAPEVLTVATRNDALQDQPSARAAVAPPLVGRMLTPDERLQRAESARAGTAAPAVHQDAPPVLTRPSLPPLVPMAPVADVPAAPVAFFEDGQPAVPLARRSLTPEEELQRAESARAGTGAPAVHQDAPPVLTRPSLPPLVPMVPDAEVPAVPVAPFEDGQPAVYSMSVSEVPPSDLVWKFVTHPRSAR